MSRIRVAMRPLLVVAAALLTLATIAAGRAAAVAGVPAVGTVPMAPAASPVIAAHPDNRLDPNGQTITVTGTGYPAQVTVQLQEATGQPTSAYVLKDVVTDSRGTFHTRVLVAYYFSVLSPANTGTCSQPTFTGAPCLLFATETAGFASANTPISFRVPSS